MLILLQNINNYILYIEQISTNSLEKLRSTFSIKKQDKVI